MGNEIREETRAKFAAALGEPAVPKELLEVTIVRAKAIVAGREAEKRLEDFSSPLSAEEKADLCAKSIVGRLMMHQKPPKNMNGTVLAENLKKQDAFIKYASGDREKLLNEIRSGEAVRAITGETPVQTQRENNLSADKHLSHDSDPTITGSEPTL